MKARYYILLLIIFTLPAVRSLFIPTFFYSHDGLLHTVRLAQWVTALRDGQIIPRWAGTLTFGLGSPVLMFYGFFPYLFAGIFHLVGLPLTWSIDMVFALSLILSGMTFFLWAREIFGDLPAFAGGLFYVWSF